MESKCNTTQSEGECCNPDREELGMSVDTVQALQVLKDGSMAA